MSKRSSNDELLAQVLSSHPAAMQEMNFLNTVFAFLNRKTKFLQQPNAAAQITQLVNKHVDKAKEQKKKNKKSKKQYQPWWSDHTASVSNYKNKPVAESDSVPVTSNDTVTVTNESITKPNTEGSNKNEDVPQTKKMSESIGVGTETQTQTETQTEIETQTQTSQGNAIQKSEPAPMEVDPNDAKDESPNEENEDDGEKPIGNGGRTDKYVWTQTLEEVELKLDIPKEKTGKDCLIVFDDKHLKVSLKGESDFIINGDLHDRILSDDCSWMLDEEYGKPTKTLTILLQKLKGMNWWSKVIVGDPEIDTKKIEPENTKLEDMDDEVQQTVNKMMWDQRQKAMGKPTSKELEQAAIMEKFKAAHPEMDFSNMKFG